ncbi:helix-turn-helix domain-containing protein [Lacticaseibacillus jixiensis]|uniref:helix-turn-helix domain-containing protein n=1 Tax=Lacticaseibacillus jixiensis TaxID=3231926 RepID=UPI0036F286F4
MDYAELFLERADGLKYQLYKLLARPHIKDVTISDLANELHSKYQPTYNVFQELLDDLEQLSGQPRQDARHMLLSTQQLPVSVDVYRSFLVNHALLYRLVDYVVQAPAASLTQFCEQEFISRSTISRKLRALNECLAQYHIRFRLARFDFVGSELNIRYFLYTMYWWAHRGVAWVFEHIAKDQLCQEAQAMCIQPPEPLADLQRLYFLAVTHLRVGKNHRIVQTPYLKHLAQVVADLMMTQGSLHPSLNWLDAAAFSFFQVSQPRFDARTRTPEDVAKEAAVLMDDNAQTVLDALSVALYQPESGDFDDDLYLNLLRVIGGMLAVSGPFPQAQDYLGGGIKLNTQGIVEQVRQAVAALPQTPVYDPFRTDQAFFEKVVVRLMGPYHVAADATRYLHVDFAVDQGMEGYRELAGFVACVPWVAQVDSRQPDLTIVCPDTKHSADDFLWYPDAFSLSTYRESLIQKLVDTHEQKKNQSEAKRI